MRWHQFFFFLLLVFLPTQLGVHFWPDWAMVLGRRVDYLSPTLFFTDILILLTISIFVISNIQYPISKQPQKLIRKLLFLLAAALFLIINIAVANNHSIAIYKWVKVLEFVLLGWYIIKIKPKFSSVITLLSIAVLYSSLLGILQFILQHSVGGPLWFLGERTFTIDTPGISRFDIGRLVLRPYATFPHPNVLGGFLAVILPMILYKVTNLQINKLTKTKKMFYILTFILGFIALLLTFSRSAIVVGGIGIGIGIWYLVFRNTKRVFSILLFFGILIMVFLLFINRVNPADESIVVRQQLNTAAVAMWQHSPLIGVGLGNFLVELPKTLPSRSVYFLQPAHNIYLLILAETGIVGFLFFVWILLKMLRRPFGIYHLSFGILLLLGLIDHYPLTLQQGQLLFTLLMGLLLSVKYSSRKI